MRQVELINIGQIQKRAIKREAFQWFWKFNEEVKKQTKKSYFKAANLNDQYRLLTLKVWSQRYKVSLQFIVKTLVLYWQKKFHLKTKGGKYGIGVGIATLVGPISEKILISAIEREFPDGENVKAWKSEQQLLRTRKPIRNIRGDDFFQKYVELMEIRQRRLEKNFNSGKYTKRRYRDSPWF